MGAVLALALGSCAYDPNYMAGGAYSSGYEGGPGYGEGYGYGGSGFSTSLFIGTGDPRWGYDPYCYCYYDYQRRCYYDPYLYGYYPSGYRPMVVVGVPHPYGYNRSFCPPPSRVTSLTLSNYHNREGAYRGSNYGWAHQVRQQAPSARSQPQFQHKQAAYPPSPTANDARARNPIPPPGGAFPSHGAGAAATPAAPYPAGQSAAPYPTGQPANYKNPSGRVNPQGGAGQATDPRHGHAAPAYQAGPTSPRTAGAASPRQAPAAANKGRGDQQGRGQADR